MGFLFLFLAVVCSVLGSLLLKQSATGLVATSWRLSDIVSLEMVGALISFGFALLFYFLALTRLPLSVALPFLTGAVNVSVALAAVFLFGEKGGPVLFLGVGLVILGLSLVIGAR